MKKKRQGNNNESNPGDPGVVVFCSEAFGHGVLRIKAQEPVNAPFLNGLSSNGFSRGVKRPLRTKSAKRPIEVGKRAINEGKRPFKAMVLVGISVGCVMGCFRAPPPWRKTAPLKRPIKRSMQSTEI